MLLIKAYHEFYSTFPFLPWKYSIESCEYFFRVARQLHNDFKYEDILNLIPKITHYIKSFKMEGITLNKEKTVRKGMSICIYAYFY